MAYPWYDVANGPDLLQGDILFDCQVLVPHYVEGQPAELRGKMQARDLIIVTQSCDLQHGKVDPILLCPIHTIHEAMQVAPDLQGKQYREALRQGNVPGLHLLEEIDLQQAPELRRPVLVVNFQTVITLPRAYVQQAAETKGNRPRLLPPYREHLSQAFARYFMRVGLPVGIAKGKLSKDALGLP